MNAAQAGQAQEVDQITRRIIGGAHTVRNTLGIGFVEKVYENTLAHTLRKDGLRVAQQHPIGVTFDGVAVGEFFAEFLAEERVLVELKAVSLLAQENVAQALNYLRATGLEVCLLINFGRSKVEIKRLIPCVYWKA